MVVNALQAVKVKLVFFVVVLKIANICDCFNPSLFLKTDGQTWANDDTHIATHIVL
jgi:hypothetical protein